MQRTIMSLVTFLMSASAALGAEWIEPPSPPAKAFSIHESDSMAHRQMTGIRLPTREPLSAHPLTQSANLPDDPGTFHPNDKAPLAMDALPLSEQVNGLPAPPQQVYATTAYPFNTIVKMVMRYQVNGEDLFYQCSGFMAGTFHVVTAGHCIYSFDPNGDGMTNDQQWAAEVWVYPGQTDLVAPYQCGTRYCGDWPYGVARAVGLRSYSGWTVNQNYDHDWGVITLDRHIGLYTGWMGRSSDLPDSANYSGYPGEQPYVPEGVNVQYWGFGTDNVVNSNSNIFELFAAIYGGHSGGPVWKFVNGERFVVGIISNGNRSDITYAVRLNSGKRDDLNNWMADDVTLNPPGNGGELIENVFDGNPHKSLNKSVVGHNEQLTIDYSIHNIGFRDITRNIIISFMASDDEQINDQDVLLDQVVTGDDIAANTVRDFSTNILIPDWLTAGQYTIGVVYETISEYPGDLDCDGTPCTNKIAIAGVPLTVEECPSDMWEDDNSLATANASNNGNSRLHSICTVGDVDYVSFEVDGDGTFSAEFETTGVSGDTFLSLLGPNGEFMAGDEDGGANQFSKITRGCGSAALSAGTYYLKVEESGNDAIIERYDLDGTVTPCPDLLFGNGFEFLGQ